MTKFWLYLICFLHFSIAANSQEIEMVSSFHRGMGCRAESTGLVLKQNLISMNFETFNSVLDPYISTSTANTTCRWTGTFRVPSGYALVMRGGEFGGYYTLRDDTTSSIHSEISLDGNNSEASSFMLNKNQSQKFYHNSSRYVSLMKGNCGGISTVQLNVSMFVRSKSDDRNWVSRVDLRDLDIPYSLEKCSP